MKIHRTALGLLSASAMSLVILGCCCSHPVGSGITQKIDRCADIAPGTLPDPIGAHVRRFQMTQVKNAEAMQFAIFLHEWYMGGKELGPYGEHHIRRIGQLLPTAPYPVLVEPTHDPEINEFRRSAIVAKLLSAGVLDADARVRIANPDAEGLFGQEAPRIYVQMLRGGGGGFGTGLPGTFLPFGGGGGGFGGGGFGGGGFPGPGVIP